MDLLGRLHGRVVGRQSVGEHDRRRGLGESAHLLRVHTIGLGELAGRGLAVATSEQGISLALKRDAGGLGRWQRRCGNRGRRCVGYGGRGRRSRAGSHGDEVVEHSLSPIGGQGGNDVHAHGLAGFRLGIVEPPRGHHLARLADQDVVQVLAGLVSNSDVPERVAMAQRARSGGYLVGSIVPPAICQAPVAHLERQRFGLVILIALQEVACLLQLDLGRLAIAFGYGGNIRFGPELLEVFGHSGGRVVEESPADVYRPGLIEFYLSRFEIAQAHLLAGFLEQPAGFLLRVHSSAVNAHRLRHRRGSSHGPARRGHRRSCSSRARRAGTRRGVAWRGIARRAGRWRRARRGRFDLSGSTRGV
jgi:hypothetical protein